MVTDEAVGLHVLGSSSLTDEEGMRVRDGAIVHGLRALKEQHRLDLTGIEAIVGQEAAMKWLRIGKQATAWIDAYKMIWLSLSELSGTPR